MRVAFDRLDLEAVVVTCHAGNEKSRRAVERYVGRHGDRREATPRHWAPPEDGAVPDEAYYAVPRGAWAAHREG